MSDIAINRDHVSLTTIPDVVEICKPLFKFTNIDFFYFVRSFDDGSCSVLLSDSKWLQHKLRYEYMLVPPVPTDLIKQKFHYLIPTEGKYKQAMIDFHNIFNFSHPFDLVVRQRNYCDLYGFATKGGERNIVNFYLNNLDLLEKFTLYFKEKAVSIITSAEQSKIKLPAHLHSNVKSISLDGKEKPFFNKTQKLIDSIKIKYRTYDCRCRQKKLSEREISCLRYLGRGRAIKEIANYLQLSPRTVESHLNSAKIKLGCYRKPDLLDFIEKNSQLFMDDNDRHAT